MQIQRQSSSQEHVRTKTRVSALWLHVMTGACQVPSYHDHLEMRHDYMYVHNIRHFIDIR